MDPVEAFAERTAGIRPSDRPFVSLSYAQSLDGSLAARPKTPLRLSGPKASALTHRLRAAHDAILVGIGTVLADDPQLTARGVPGPQPQPVVLDTHLRTPPNGRIFAHPRHPWIVTATDSDPRRAEVLKHAGAQIIEVEARDSGLEIGPALQELARRGVQRLMVEGGPTVIASFLAAGLVDWVLLTIAPTFIGGVRVAGHAGANGDAHSLRQAQWMNLDGDLVVWGELA